MRRAAQSLSERRLSSLLLLLAGAVLGVALMQFLHAVIPAQLEDAPRPALFAHGKSSPDSAVALRTTAKLLDQSGTQQLLQQQQQHTEQQPPPADGSTPSRVFGDSSAQAAIRRTAGNPQAWNFTLTGVQPTEPPAGYLAACESRPLEPVPGDIGALLDACPAKLTSAPLPPSGVLLRRILKAGDCSSPMSLGSFVCEARCPRFDPEIERTFGNLGVAKLRLKGLMRLCRAGSFPFLVRIRNNEIRVYRCQEAPTGKTVFREVIKFLENVACQVRLPNVVFGFDSSDFAIPSRSSPLKYASPGWLHPLPGVVRFVGTDAQPSALFPTPPAIKGVGLRSWMEKNQPSVSSPVIDGPPWESRQTDIFWRGGSTGIPFDRDFIWMMTRPSLCRHTHDVPGFDVALTTKDGINDKLIAEGFYNFVRSADYMSASKWNHFRYQLHVDGNSASWGLMHKLHLNATLVWQRSPVTYREFYYDLLRPWEHYVPLLPDLGNILQVRDWLGAPPGPTEAREIRDRLNKLVETRLRAEDIVCYTVRLMYAIAEMQEFDPVGDLDTYIKPDMFVPAV